MSKQDFGLNDKQKKFIEEYLVLGNIKHSAIRAGYSEKTAQVQGSRLLSNVKVQEYLKFRQDEIREELQQQFSSAALTAQRVMLKILNDPGATNKDKITVAKDFLDRAGFVPTTKQEISGVDGGAIKIVFKDPDTG